VPASAWLLAGTRFGLRLRAAGEAPEAAAAAGIGVGGVRWRALALCGGLCGLAGSYLSIGHGSAFLPEMTAGKGYLALAALIFGRWRPWPAFFACLLFAVADAVQIRLQGLGGIPVQAIQALPYLLTLVLLAGWVGRAVAPQALGRPLPPP
jgi:simple sugar transport system permease protein